jgi:hypothetical protein
MGWLDSLFGNYPLDPHNDSGTGSGWLGPIAGGPVPFNRSAPSSFPPMAPPNVSAAPAAPADSGIGRESARPGPSMSLLGGMGTGATHGIAGPFGQAGMGGASQGPSLLERLTAGATNLTTGGNPLAGLLNAVNGLATGQRTDRAGVELGKQHATMRALMNAGLDLDTARAAAINPEFLKALVVARYGVRPMRGQLAAPPRAGTGEAGRKEPAPVGDFGPDAGLAAGPTADVPKPRS